MIDAMGHGLNAALMATLAIGAYRHARRIDVELADLYEAMDTVVEDQFGPESSRPRRWRGSTSALASCIG
ncbi:MAG TPA: SpoIIE family protein phosphatase [Nocardioidaceae bacterium]|nr:SpoIIE family protein phosphatase [Nocardioidaceae bacterium]